MLRIIIVHPLPLFISGLHLLLTGNDSFILVGELSFIDNLTVLLQKSAIDVVLISERVMRFHLVIPTIKDLYPDLKIILFVPDYSDEYLYRMVESNADTVLRESADISELTKSILVTHEGSDHLPGEVQQRIRKIYREEHSRAAQIKLTTREQEILDCIGKGMGKEKICGYFIIEMNTLNSHLRNLYSKFDVHNMHELEHKARKLRYIK